MALNLPFDMQQVAIVLVALVSGLMGTTIRIFLQYKRDGSFPASGLDIYVEAFLGCVAGGLMWLTNIFDGMREVAVMGLIAGYAGVDFIENWFEDRREEGE